MVTEQKPCEARVVVGGGKKAKRRGEQFAKWFCPRCQISGWMDTNLKAACDKVNEVEENGDV